MQVGWASDPGQVRERNEDAVFFWQCMLMHQGQPPLPLGLFAVADGMGGQAEGEKASSLAVRLAAQHVIQRICLPFLDDSVTDRPPINQVLETGVYIAHQAVLRHLPDAGTTLTMALLLGDYLFIAHVGDCRAYLGERGRLRCLTQDHSLAARLVEMGQGTAEEVASQRHLLYKALGQSLEVEPDIIHQAMGEGQYLLLCSDGLWSMVSEEQMRAVIEAAPTLTSACQELVHQANQQGGDDNISVILLAKHWPLPPSPHRSP